MKSLKESLLDDEDVLLKDTGDNMIIEKFLKDNYKIGGSYTIKNGLVDVDGHIRVTNYNITNLTNGLFKFNKIKGLFDCSKCAGLKTLEGAPKECRGFKCNHCLLLKTLEGAPEKCETFLCSYCADLVSLEGSPKECEDFDCHRCINLKSLKYALKKCYIFDCGYCVKLKTLEGAPEKCLSFDCSYCDGLQSLKGAPKKCTEFYCDNKFSEEDVKKVCDVKRVFI